MRDGSTTTAINAQQETAPPPTLTRQLGAHLIIGFAVIGLTTVLSTSLGDNPLSLAPTALLIAWTVTRLPHNTWTALPAPRATATTATTAVGLALIWAAALGAHATSWTNTTGITAALIAWLTLIATNFTTLARAHMLLAATTIITVAGISAALSTPQGLADITTQITTGLTSPAFTPALLVAGLVTIATTTYTLTRDIDLLWHRSDMRSLAATFAGAATISLGTVVLVSTRQTTWAGQDSGLQFTIAALIALFCPGIALFVIGALTTRGGNLKPTGAIPLIFGLGLIAVGGWTGFTANGLGAIPALLLIVLATTFGVTAGIAFAAAVVRDGHHLRARFNESRERAEARATQTVRRIASAVHATS
ncbi:hypothetical protein [Dermatophilus congolensis]|uniref:hypothetical protein n=1 Tax=Dermatophilus congolensis TaxID=1863 RepID=UPI001AB04BAB|nr:hypothetical protein [Dermatophilus congolensis]MBO3153210.1 hypothetical protein [Dermatophilus congolensis]MBO3187063.1 hypothetical protein [Dermatophilus congolensis]